jgi:hypothetical protein
MDAIPAANCRLCQLPPTGHPAAGCAGSFPGSFVLLKSLQYLNLADNSLAGRLPGLPPNLRLFNIRCAAHYIWVWEGWGAVEVQVNVLVGGAIQELDDLTGLLQLPTLSRTDQAALALWLKTKRLLQIDTLYLRPIC